MKLLMLLESTVCLSSAPVPSHTKGMTRNNHIWLLRYNLGGKREKSHLHSFQPFGQSPLQSSHFLWPSFSTSILSDGQALTQELPSTTKWAVRRRKKRKTQGICFIIHMHKIKRFTIRLLSRFLKPTTSFYQLCSILYVSYPPWTPPWLYGTHMNTPDPTQHLKTSVSWLELLYLSHVVFSFWLCYIFCLTV